MSFIDKFKNKFNVFNKKQNEESVYQRPSGIVSSNRPDRTKLKYGNERSIVAAIYNRIATDFAQIKMEVVRVNENGQYIETIKSSGLNNCLTVEANIDQTASCFKRDMVMSLLDEGVIAVCPIDTNINPRNTDSYDILTMRVGRITAWYPEYVNVNIYDDRSGLKKDVCFPKDKIAIVENPFFSIMNESNSTLKRLITKLTMMDIVDEQTSSGKLDIIIQLPYVIKSDARKAQAEQRRTDIEQQLAGSKYGIAYTDGTEHITQLNRPAESNLLNQIEYLTKLLFSQLGITQEILEGTANEEVMNNYYERTIEPIVAAFTEEFTRKFISKTSRTQGKVVKSFNDPFRFVPTSKLPDLADRLIRNEILSPNEMRGVIGYKPSEDPAADELRNPNISQPEEYYDEENPNYEDGEGLEEEYEDEDENQNESENVVSLLREQLEGG